MSGFPLSSWPVGRELASWLHPEAISPRWVVSDYCSHFSTLTRVFSFGTRTVFVSCIVTLSFS